MKRILDTSRNGDVEFDRQSGREPKLRCRFKPVSCLRSDHQKSANGCSSLGRLTELLTEDTSELDASDSDNEAVENSNFVGGIISSRVCKSRIPRMRMKKFMFISFKEEGPNPDFLGCPEWAKPMLAVYYQLGFAENRLVRMLACLPQDLQDAVRDAR
eukprot:CAMPEP_0172188764 /NCGR_PEP_ID=MMETSP1050-20130122/22136_1 /TAXON_ID=233186 /ORGANISM="Cryptomonas curvata, Strain CCAP979/52" /LENGTH=157 /DNA_ID=CAMNT_0012863357 /DNA_START=237 /DNA_END=706 /DNA_ORIENTATION=+